MIVPRWLLATSYLSVILFCWVLASPSGPAQKRRETHPSPPKSRAWARFEQDPATYDDACNIGFCSIMGVTMGGWGASYTFVSTQAAFVAAVAGTEPGIVVVQGAISGSGKVSVGSGKTIVGTPGSSLSGISLLLAKSRNVIVRNLRISSNSSNADGEQAITIESSRSIWIDHCDLDSGSRISITKGSDYMTITNNLFHDHQDEHPAVTIGHSDDNAAEDQGKFHVTFARNHFRNVNNAVSVRFGTGHLFNSIYDRIANGINTRMGADVLVEASVFISKQGTESRAVFSAESKQAGFATVQDVVLGGSTNTAPTGKMTRDSFPYPYDWYIYDTETIQSALPLYAGQTLEFMI